MKQLEQLGVRVEKDIKKYLKIKAAIQGVSVQDLVNEIFTKWVNEQKGGNENE